MSEITVIGNLLAIQRIIEMSKRKFKIFEKIEKILMPFLKKDT